MSTPTVVCCIFSYILGTPRSTYCTLNPIIAFGYSAFKTAAVGALVAALPTVVVAIKFTMSAIENDFVAGLS